MSKIICHCSNCKGEFAGFFTNRKCLLKAKNIELSRVLDQLEDTRTRRESMDFSSHKPTSFLPDFYSAEEMDDGRLDPAAKVLDSAYVTSGHPIAIGEIPDHRTAQHLSGVVMASLPVRSNALHPNREALGGPTPEMIRGKDLNPAAYGNSR